MSSNHKTAVERMAGPIGSDLGRSDHVTQAAFLNEFAGALYTGCGGDGSGGWDDQFVWVVGELDPLALRMLVAFAEFAKLEQDDPKPRGGRR